MIEAKKYTVHVYKTVRVPIEVEADNSKDAITKALRFNDVYALPGEDAKEISGYLVDVPNDPDHNKSVMFQDAAFTVLQKLLEKAEVYE